MKEFTIKDFTFRIKKMNAVELLALRSQISFDSFESTQNAYNTLLTKCEVKVKDAWIQVKQNNDFYPAGVEDDVEVIEGIIKEIISYVKEVFQKSNASN